MDRRQTHRQINWYPGHMFKSFKAIEKNLKIMDLVFVLIDARIPDSSMNPQILKVLKTKPTIILLNKMDLADKKELNKWIKHYEDRGHICLAIDAQSGTNVNQIKSKAEELLEERLATQKRRGLKERNLRTMVLGIPNVGKSTLINRLSNRRSTRVGDRPGVTRTEQWVKLSNDFDLLDMPGVLWPKFEDPKVGYNLAITGAIKDDILPLDDVVFFAIKFLQKHYLDRLQERYSDEITSDMDFVEFLDLVGKLRGALIRGGEIDYDRVYQIILNDIRNKRLGELSFDKL